jgi:cytochrome c biogenesis factor
VTVIGELSLWVALFLAAWGSVASVAGTKLNRDELVVSGRRAIFATAGMTAVAALGLWMALLGHDFSLRYVASHTTLNTPTLYLLTAIWAGPEGRMLFLGLAISLAAAIAAAGRRELDPPSRGPVLGILAGLVALVLAVACFRANPYDRLEWVPAEGQGLAPDLQSALAPVYFVATYIGYAAASVVLALSVPIAALGRLDDARLMLLRRWAAVCWSLLTVAIALRMRWTYVDASASPFGRPGAAQSITASLWAASFALLWLRLDGQAGLERRDRPGRRWTGLVVFSLGLALVIAGVGASRRWTTHTVPLSPGGAAEIVDPSGARWRFVSQGVSRDEQSNYLSTSVALETWCGGTPRGVVSAERRQYLDSVQRPTFAPVVKPGIRSSLRQDVHVVFAGLEEDDAASLRLAFRPLVALIWIGWMLVLAGGIALASAPRFPKLAVIYAAPPRE